VLEDLQAVGNEVPFVELLKQDVLREVSAPSHLALLQVDRSIPFDLIHGYPAPIVRAEVKVVKEESRFRADNPQLLGDLAPRRLSVLLAGADDAAHEHIVHRREDVLRIGAAVDEDFTAAVAAKDAHAAVEQVPGADLSPPGAADHAVFAVNQVDQFLAGVRR
jgi:hypothetical protein